MDPLPDAFWTSLYTISSQPMGYYIYIHPYIYFLLQRDAEFGHGNDSVTEVSICSSILCHSMMILPLSQLKASPLEVLNGKLIFFKPNLLEHMCSHNLVDRQKAKAEDFQPACHHVTGTIVIILSCCFQDYFLHSIFVVMANWNITKISSFGCFMLDFP